jgi:hypothetical protein
VDPRTLSRFIYMVLLVMAALLAYVALRAVFG